MRSIAERLAYSRRYTPHLNPLLFDDDGVLKGMIRKKIQDIVDAFLEYAQVTINVLDVRLVGSNASYNYNEYSDLDIHIVTDLSKIADPEMIARLYFDSVKKNFKDSYDITIKDIDVELYVEDVNTSANSNGVYSVTKDKWIKEPVVMEDPSDDEIAEAEKIEDAILDSIEEAKNKEDLEKIIDDIYLMRKDSLASAGESGAGNLAFKSLRNKGILDKIKNILREKESKELSLESKKITESISWKSLSKEEAETIANSTLRGMSTFKGDLFEGGRLFHVSPHSNRGKIRAQGLKSPVYLTSDYERMLSDDYEFVRERGSLDLYIVDVKGLDLRLDPEWSDYEYDEDYKTHEPLAMIYQGSISRTRVKYVGNIDLGKGPIGYKVMNPVIREDLIRESTSPLKTLKGSVIKRSPKYGVGKEIGGQVYVHKDYARRVIDPDIYELALKRLNQKYPDFEFNCVMWDKKKPNAVRFDEAPDFDTAREPIPGKMISYDLDTGKFTERYSNQIWHHKWLWVLDDYTGFDVQASYNWSKKWLQKITSPSGYKDKWDSALASAGLD